MIVYASIDTQFVTQSSDLQWGDNGAMMLWVEAMKTFMVAGFVSQGKNNLAPGAVLLLPGLLAGLLVLWIYVNPIPSFVPDDL